MEGAFAVGSSEAWKPTPSRALQESPLTASGRTAPILLAALLGTLLLGAAATGARASASYHLGLRVGSFDMTNSADSYDAVYGSNMTQVGARFEARFNDRWFLSLAADFGDVDGEQVAFGLDGPFSTGIPTTLELLPIHLSYGRILGDPEAWSFLFGLGVTLVDWEEATRFESTSGSDAGAHAFAGVRRNLGRWDLDLELLYTSVSGALEGGAAQAFGEDDLGGLKLTLGLSFRL